MDRHDRLRARLRGTDCTVCGAGLDAARIRVLAEREDLAFVELPCVACGARTLGMITGPLDGSSELDLAEAAEPRPPDQGRPNHDPAFTLEDVRAMHRFLAGYRGDLRGLLGGRMAGPDVGPGPTR